MKAISPLFLLLAGAALPAQNVFHGNGIPSAYVENTPARLGGSLAVSLGSPTTPGSIGVLAISAGFGPVFVPHPLVGLVGIDPLDPAFELFFFGLDGNGNASVSAVVPPGFATPTTPPLFAVAVTFEGALWSISKTVRIDWANPDGWEPAATLATARQLHTATALGRNPRDNTTEVLICGGATGSIIIPTPHASAELYSPLLRTVTPLAGMSLPRSAHRAVLLDNSALNGLVLITGGVTSGGVVTATCELFDSVSGQFIPAPSMNAPRAGHAITLLDDGRVLVSGGVADWQSAATNFIGVLNSAQNTAELFDPAAFTWTPLPIMASKRFGHTQTRLPDGRVLLVSGIAGGFTGTNPLGSGGQVPFYTDTCEVFDPATLAFTPTAPIGPIVPPFLTLPGRGFHGASLLPNGHVLITGGFVAGGQNGEAVATPSCGEWDGALWSITTALSTAAAFHTQVPHGTGALVMGGFTGDLTQLQTTAVVVQHDVAAITARALIGTDGGGGTQRPRAAHTCTPLYDGTFLVYGGGLWPNTLGDGWIYTGN